MVKGIMLSDAEMVKGIMLSDAILTMSSMNVIAGELDA
jgi:NADH-quinone oxidoreductase subunit D